MSVNSNKSLYIQQSQDSDSIRSFKHLDYDEFNLERKKILKESSRNNSPEDFHNFYNNNPGFSFTGHKPFNNSQMKSNINSIMDYKEDIDYIYSDEKNNTEKKRNMVLEIRLKEKEENLLKMAQNQDDLNNELDYYKQKLEQVQDSNEQMINDYEVKLQNMIEEFKEKEKKYIKENSNLKRVNQEFVENNSNSFSKNRLRSNSTHKFDNSSKRLSIEGRESQREGVEIDKLKKDLEKTKLVLDNVYQDNERLINLIKELENNKKESEKLQTTNDCLQKEYEVTLQEIEKLKEIIEDMKLMNDDLKQVNDKILNENEKIIKEHDKIIKENQQILKEIDQITKENEKLIQENEKIYLENQENLKINKKKEHQMQANYLSQLQELTSNSQIQLKTKLNKFESIIDDLKKENKALKVSNKTPEKILNNNKENENPSNFNKNNSNYKEFIDIIMNLMGNKSYEAIINKIKEMMTIQKNTHKLLNSIADLMKNIVPNVTKPTLKEMWSFLKFTIKNYQEFKTKYEASSENLEIYGKIKQILNSELKEEVLHNLNTLISEKKVFLQIINKIKTICRFKDEISLNEINQELTKWHK